MQERVDAKSGLCPFHKKHGEGATRSIEVKPKPKPPTEVISTVRDTPVIELKETSRGKRPKNYRTKVHDQISVLTDSEISEIQREIDLLGTTGVDYQILRMISVDNRSNTYIAQKLGWTYQSFTNYFAKLCERIKIPKSTLRNAAQCGIFRRETIRRVFKNNPAP
jgi:hypothetical protein